jgi:demethylmenaquinone methyltransferase/2-methoxy-6-polyprenyl-1,4-benzoquinol methylase
MENRELPFVREMFDNIAPHYDRLNRILSMRQDVVWRKKMVSAISIPQNGRVLDVACGTGDVAMEIRRQKASSVGVVGIDFSPGMLALARRKSRRFQAHATLSLLAGDALKLPFRQSCFHAITIAFGIRNIQDKPGALNAFYECLAPGGMILVLELATPRESRLKEAYLAYFNKILPIIGRLFSKHRFAYSYLPDSVSRFPEPAAFMSIMRNAGFSNIDCRRLTFGIANLFVGIKPR